MPYFRLVAAAIGLAAPVAFTTASAARPPARHPPAYVRTATYHVAHHAAQPGGHAAPGSRADYDCIVFVHLGIGHAVTLYPIISQATPFLLPPLPGSA